MQINQVKIGVTTLIIFIIICIIIYIYKKVTYVSTYCKTINKVYSDMGKVRSINLDDANFKGYLLRDYYIKTAYNCCAIGEFKNTFVDLCALKQVIRQGVRALDFQIYSVDDKPVIAVSTIPCDYTDDEDEKQCYLIKESYNSIDFADAMKIISTYCFAGDTCPNPNDPLFLHFRIMSVNKHMYKEMTDIIDEYFATKMLDKEYSYEYNGHNLGNVPISELVNKVIISVDKNNPYFEETPLVEFVNICSNSMFMRTLREDDVKYTPDYAELLEYNKKNLTMEMPNLSIYDNNVSAQTGFKYGVQMVAMCYQNFDSNLEFYETFFTEAGFAFVLKPEELRYKPVTIEAPTPQNPELSYADREYKADYYTFKI